LLSGIFSRLLSPAQPFHKHGDFWSIKENEIKLSSGALAKAVFSGSLGDFSVVALIPGALLSCPEEFLARIDVARLAGRAYPS
jgi:hypothetical protein